MTFRTLLDKNVNIEGKIILYRSPYDIETQEINGKYTVKDDSRIRATLSTLTYLLRHNCKIVILTWVGRPNRVDPRLSTKPHAEALSNLIGVPVKHVADCIGTKVEAAINQMNPKDIIMLENTRFHREDDAEDDLFAKTLTKGSDLIVFDAFPQAHRTNASITGILKHLPSYAGFYFRKEVNSLNNLIFSPKRPFTVVIGGKKVSDKIEAISNLYNIADIVLVGGAVANTFLKAEGKNMGTSFTEDQSPDAENNLVNWIDTAKRIQEQQSNSQTYKNFQISTDIHLHKIQHPYDLVIGKYPINSIKPVVVKAHKEINVVPDGLMALDIGPIASKIFSEIIAQSQTVLWAGPMGMYEAEKYSNGTKKVVEAICKVKSNGGFSVVAGGDTVAALNKFGKPSQISHISLAGGAALDFLAGKKLPALEALCTQQ